MMITPQKHRIDTETQSGVKWIFSVVLWSFCVLCGVEVLALEWPWEKTKAKEKPSGFTSDQVLERSEANKAEIKRQLSPEPQQRGTVIYSSVGQTYVDVYDEKGIAHRVNLDQNGDGKVGSDDFLLTWQTSEKKNVEPKESYALTGADFLKEPKFIQELFEGKWQQDTEDLNREIAFSKNQVQHIEQEILPAINRTQTRLREALFGFEEAIVRVDQQLLRFGVEVQKPNGEESIKVPLDSPEASTIRKLLLQRRQLLIQTGKFRELMEAQESYRSNYLNQINQLKVSLADSQNQLSQIQKEKKKLRSALP